MFGRQKVILHNPSNPSTLAKPARPSLNVTKIPIDGGSICGFDILLLATSKATAEFCFYVTYKRQEQEQYKNFRRRNTTKHCNCDYKTASQHTANQPANSMVMAVAKVIKKVVFFLSKLEESIMTMAHSMRGDIHSFAFPL